MPLPSQPDFLFTGTLERVIDGDTIVARLDLRFRVGYSAYIRIRGVNAPELNQAAGHDAKNFLRELLTDKPLLVYSHGEQSFARWVGDVWLNDESGQSVSKALVDSGHAVATAN